MMTGLNNRQRNRIIPPSVILSVAPSMSVCFECITICFFCIVFSVDA